MVNCNQMGPRLDSQGRMHIGLHVARKFGGLIDFDDYVGIFVQLYILYAVDPKNDVIKRFVTM